MKNKLILLFALFITTAPALTFAGNIAVSAEMAGETVVMVQNQKKKKGPRKPRKKKFLGIFKRKSACDCPKH